MSSLKDDSKPKATTTLDTSTQNAIQTLKNVASNIREASSRMRDVVRALRESGVIDELTAAIHEAMIATRDTAREINEITKELKDHGVIKDVTTAVEETIATTHEIGETAKYTSQQVSESAPITGEALRKAADRIKASKNKSTEPS